MEPDFIIVIVRGVSIYTNIVLRMNKKQGTLTNSSLVQLILKTLNG